FCARLASAPIDLTRPPWGFHLVEHVDGDGLGFVIRAHHCMLDGTGMTAFVGLFAELVATPAAIDEPQPWRPQSPPSRSRLVRSGVADSARRSADAIADGWRRAVRVREWGEGAREAARTASAVRELIAPVGAKTEFNRPTSDSRTVDFTHASLAAAKNLAHARGATINHVGIAVVTDALRRFFDRPGARRPARALKLLVPVSYEPHPHDGEPGAEPAAAEEHIGFATVALPLEEPDPDVRLAAIVAQAHDQTEHSSPERVDELMRHIARDSDRLYRLAQRLVQSPRTAALTLSNVRGPAFPIYLRGARIRELYPLLPLGPHHDLAVGMLSLEEKLFFAAMRTDSGHDSLAEFGGCMEEAVASLGLAPRHGDRPPQAAPNDQPKSTNGG
ncbi:MAG: WS/DGAT domain-containing protein, partial [Actinomycetota bacterium]|nr:WS/DGAT domain-containing protein [Actinomycetota bacterium]